MYIIYTYTYKGDLQNQVNDLNGLGDSIDLDKPQVHWKRQVKSG